MAGVGEPEQVINLPDVSQALGVRDTAMLETFYSTGIRRMEVAGITLYDIDRERGTLTVPKMRIIGIVTARCLH